MTTATSIKNEIANPFTPGMTITIPAGTAIRSMNPRDPSIKYAKKTTRVRLRMTGVGWIDMGNDHKKGIGYVRLPVVTWPGTGGYWQDAQITPELCAANGVEMPEIPDIHSDGWQWSRHVTMEPSYEDGHTNRWPTRP